MQSNTSLLKFKHFHFQDELSRQIYTASTDTELEAITIRIKSLANVIEEIYEKQGKLHLYRLEVLREMPFLQQKEFLYRLIASVQKLYHYVLGSTRTFEAKTLDRIFEPLLGVGHNTPTIGTNIFHILAYMRAFKGERQDQTSLDSRKCIHFAAKKHGGYYVRQIIEKAYGVSEIAMKHLNSWTRYGGFFSTTIKKITLDIWNEFKRPVSDDLAKKIDREEDIYLQLEIMRKLGKEIKKNGDLSKLKALYSNGSISDVSELHRAAHWDFPDLAFFILNNGGDVNARDSKGNTPLHYAIKYGSEKTEKVLRAFNANDILCNKKCLFAHQMKPKDRKHHIFCILSESQKEEIVRYRREKKLNPPPQGNPEFIFSDGVYTCEIDENDEIKFIKIR